MTNTNDSPIGAYHSGEKSIVLFPGLSPEQEAAINGLMKAVEEERRLLAVVSEVDRMKGSDAWIEAQAEYDLAYALTGLALSRARAAGLTRDGAS